MILINEGSREKIENLSENEIVVIADFDKTISTKTSNTTFSLFSKSGSYPLEYAKDREKLYQYYRPIELDPSISDEEKYRYMQEWQTKAYELLLKYHVREEDIDKIVNRSDLIELRRYAIEFIKSLNSRDIPLIINSAGIGNFICALLKRYGVMKDNIYVFSNMLEFNNGEIIDSIDSIIHSMNKYNMTITPKFREFIASRKKIVLIGDQLSDLKMAGNLAYDELISFGFLESKVEENEQAFIENFDVVLKDDETFESISKILNLK